MAEAVLSVAALGGFLWTLRYLVPKALKERDRFAVGSALLTAALALFTWLLIGVSVSSW